MANAMTPAEELALIKQQLADAQAEAAQAKAEAQAAKQALGKRSGTAGLSFRITNDGMPAGEPDAEKMKALETTKERSEYSKQFCRGTISVDGLNARFPDSKYLPQWLRLMDGLLHPEVLALAKSLNPDAFGVRFGLFLTDEATVNHYAIKAAAARKAE